MAVESECAEAILTPPRRPDLTGPLAIAKPDWETYCHKVADLIVAEQSPARVMEVRAKFYELLSHCIPPTVILKVRFELLVVLSVLLVRMSLSLVFVIRSYYRSFHPSQRMLQPHSCARPRRSSLMLMMITGLTPPNRQSPNASSSAWMSR